MPINVFGNSSNNSEIKIDTPLFVKKSYLKTIYIQTDIEENIDLKNILELKIYPILLALEKQLQKNMLIMGLTNLVF